MDVEAAEKFVDQFDEIIEKGGYCPEQIFNVDETGLFFGRKCPKGPTYTKKLKQCPVSRTGSRCCWEEMSLGSS